MNSKKEEDASNNADSTSNAFPSPIPPTSPEPAPKPEQQPNTPSEPFIPSNPPSTPADPKPSDEPNRPKASEEASKSTHHPPLINSTTEPDVSHNVAKACIIGGIFLLIFGIWGFFANIESASMAPGKVIVSTNRKQIQHLTGGRIKTIFVNDGDIVKKGDPLVQIDDTQEKLQKIALQKEYDQYVAISARLNAQLNNAATVIYPKELMQRINEPDVKEIIDLNENQFKVHNQYLTSQLQVLNERIAKFTSNIATIEKKLIHEKSQLELLKTEETEVKSLWEQKLVNISRFLGIQREREKTESNISALEGEKEDAEKSIQGAKAEQESLIGQTSKDDIEKLSGAQAKIYELQEKLNSVNYIIDNSLIVAPVNGTVIGLKVHTLDSVIRPGDLIMEIVPGSDKLVLEAYINPSDIDTIKIGQVAKVDLLPYSQRYTPWLIGELTQISADVFTDDKTGKSYYKALVEISAAEMEKNKDIKLYPGMPVEVIIINARRTPIQYLFQPVYRSLNRAFRET